MAQSILEPLYIVAMVMHSEQSFCIPRLIREISAEESAPPLAVAR